MDIGKSIKEMRLKAHMKQKDLAEKMNLSNRTISSWETNRTQPQMEDIEAMCKIFNCKKSDFLGDVDYLVEYSDNEQFLIEAYRQANDTEKRLVQYVLRLSQIKKENNNGISKETK